MNFTIFQKRKWMGSISRIWRQK